MTVSLKMILMRRNYSKFNILMKHFKQTKSNTLTFEMIRQKGC